MKNSDKHENHDRSGFFVMFFSFYCYYWMLFADKLRVCFMGFCFMKLILIVDSLPNSN